MATTNPDQTPPPTPEQIEQMHQDVCNLYQRRIQQATFRISERVKTAERVVLDRYIRCVSPKVARTGDNEFPSSLRRSARNPERFHAKQFPNILHFHVANAIYTYYELVIGLEVRDALEHRVKLIEQIGKLGLTKYVILGNDLDGYEMIHRDERPVPFSTGPEIDPEVEHA